MANYREIVSVKYRQGFFVGFDPDGKLLWDASLPVEDVETSDIEQINAFGTTSKEFQIVYKNEDEGLYYTKGSPANVLRNDSLVTVKLLDADDKLRGENEKTGKVELWYDNVFFVWGIQRIQNMKTNQRRHVFYINKIRIE